VKAGLPVTVCTDQGRLLFPMRESDKGPSSCRVPASAPGELTIGCTRTLTKHQPGTRILTGQEQDVARMPTLPTLGAGSAAP
jgi:hypothetical protein